MKLHRMTIELTAETVRKLCEDEAMSHVSCGYASSAVYAYNAQAILEPEGMCTVEITVTEKPQEEIRKSA